MDNYGIECTGFDDLAKKIEELGMHIDIVAKDVLTAGGKGSVNAFKSCVPVSKRSNEQGHARDNVKLTRVKKNKNGRHQIQHTFKGDRSYLYMIDKGSRYMVAHPWRANANNAVNRVAYPIMRAKLEEIIDRELNK